MFLKSFKFRLYPNKLQRMNIHTHLWLSKNLWNELLAFTKEIYKNYSKFPTKRTLRELVKNSNLYSQVGQELVDRLIDALDRKITLKKKGQVGGFPRFKSIDGMRSLVYPQSGFKLLESRKLQVTPFGKINIKKHRDIVGKIKNLTIKREPSGKYFAIFCVETVPEKSKINSGDQVGVDLGLMNLATLSNGKIIKNPHQFDKLAQTLASAQRKLSRKKKKSHNRKKEQLKVARIHEKISNIRRDYLHKQANYLLSNYSLLALENLKIKEMVMRGHGKNINDASWGIFTNILSYKAEGAGLKIVFVDPRNTSNMCSRCGIPTKKTLWERQHNCLSCGLSINRDLNAAINILTRATVGMTGSNACGDETIVSSSKQEAHGFSRG